MTITNLKQQVKNPDRVSVFVDGKYSLSLTLDEVISGKIKQGIELDEPRLKELKKISSDGKLKARALVWVLNRPHSVREFKSYMIRKKAEPDLIEKISQEFIGRGYLDDYKYAQWLVDLRARSGKSDRALKSELYSKGIGREVVSQVLKDSGDEAQRLKVVIEKKRKLSRYKNDDSKLAKYLTSQGFSYSLVKQQLEISE